MGNCRPPFILGEVGINHNGDVNNALKMVEIAKKVGLDAVKFQTFRADEIVSNIDQRNLFHYIEKDFITDSIIEKLRSASGV